MSAEYCESEKLASANKDCALTFAKQSETDMDAYVDDVRKLLDEARFARSRNAQRILEVMRRRRGHVNDVHIRMLHDRIRIGGGERRAMTLGKGGGRLVVAAHHGDEPVLLFV